jgi:murein DD-endopeptidase MepM/ murein hydrolase activator NlpD
VVLVAVLLVAVLGGVAVPATAETTTTSPGTPTSTTSATTTTSTTTTTVPAEIPADEAQLQVLLDTVHTQLQQLSGRVSQIDAEITSNQAKLDIANAQLAQAEAAASVADVRRVVVSLARVAALVALRQVAVAAYIHQPISDLANLLLHLSDPADLETARGFYRTIVEVEHHAMATSDRLAAAAAAAAAHADQARDDAARHQQSVADTQQQLRTLRQTLVEIGQATAAQQAQETALQGTLGTDRGRFEAELAAQAGESARIAALLQGLAVPGDTAPAPGGGYFSLPVPGAPMTQRYGPNTDPFTGAPGFHPGVDFAARVGTPIDAAGAGTVVFAGQENGYGNYTCISHSHNLATCYGHQSSILVKVGDQVVQGQVIGLVGSTGYSTGPHLHFEVRINGSPVDPLPWLR